MGRLVVILSMIQQLPHLLIGCIFYGMEHVYNLYHAKLPEVHTAKTCK